ncbi:MAG: PHP domain-containing protein [Firmicutes bacterium]|nr:PHP domain-containing protein [Bacillota bacterium]
MAGFDTHVHSTASDGALSPRELVELARERQLLGLAVTDHDTVDGLAEAMAAGEELDVTVLPGIELSAEHNEQDVHVLGYWIDREKLLATGRLQQLSEARTGRIREIVRRLSLLGFELDAEAILSAAGTSPGRPHVAAAMVEAGYVTTVGEAFAKWLGRGLPAFVPRAKLTPFEAVELIRTAGGVAALAHPGCGVPDQLIPMLVRAGIGGIEVYHPDHNRAAEKKYAALARRYGLAALGGSDFHVPGLRELGCRVTTVGQLGKLAARRQD